MQRGCGDEQGQPIRLLDAVVGLVGAEQIDQVLERAIDAVRDVTGAESAWLDPVAQGSTLQRGSVGASSSLGQEHVDELRVPLEAEGTVIARIALTGKRDGSSFTSEDEELAMAVAAVAGAAIERLTLRREHRRDRWVALLSEIASALLAGAHSEEVLALAARGARVLVAADLVAICVMEPFAHLTVRAADGDGAERFGQALERARGTRFEELVATGETVVIRNASRHKWCEPLVYVGVTGPALFAPLSLSGGATGTLAVVRGAGQEPFSDADRWLVELLATQVKVALEYGVAHQELKRVAVAASQERIARDLHDTVIQQLFAIGMSLQTVLRSMSEHDAIKRVSEAIDGLDETITDIRETVFELQHPPLQLEDFRSEVVMLADEISRAFGFSVEVRFSGASTVELPETVAVDVLAVVREALSNAGRHAFSRHVDIAVEVGAELVVRVADDGIGIPFGANRRSGLRNLEQRAIALGGTMRALGAPTQGTVVVWQVPLAAHPVRTEGLTEVRCASTQPAVLADPFTAAVSV